MSHSPYSLDFLSNDFFLFSIIKNIIDRQRFFSPYKSVIVYIKLNFETPTSESNKSLKLVSLYVKCNHDLDKYYGI